MQWHFPCCISRDYCPVILCKLLLLLKSLWKWILHTYNAAIQYRPTILMDAHGCGTFLEPFLYIKTTHLEVVEWTSELWKCILSFVSICLLTAQEEIARGSWPPSEGCMVICHALYGRLHWQDKAVNDVCCTIFDWKGKNEHSAHFISGTEFE